MALHRPLLVATDDRPADGSRYVREAEALAAIQSAIRADLKATGRDTFKPEAIVAASNIVRSYPTAWTIWRGGGDEQRVLEAWKSAREEIADPSKGVARLRVQAAEQARFAKEFEADAAEWAGRETTARERGRTEEADRQAEEVARNRRSGARCAERATELTAEADALEAEIGAGARRAA